MDDSKRYIKIDVSGQSNELWSELRIKLIGVVNKFLDTTIDSQNNSTIRDEAKEFTSALLKHAKDKLARAGIENEKIIAEIDHLYTMKQKELAEIRKINAETNEIEFSTSIKKLKLSLGMTKALLIGQKDEEDIVFVKQIDNFIEVLKEFEISK